MKNYYRLLGLSLLTAFVFSSILTFRTGVSREDLNLILTYETDVKFSLTQFRIFITGYFIALSAIAFWVGRTTTLPLRFFWWHVLWLAIPLTIFTVFIMFPEWTTFPLFSNEGIPGGYYNDINSYGRFNVFLIILNALGLSVFGLQTAKLLKRT